MADPSTGLSYYAGIYAFNMFVLFLSGLFKAMVFVKLTLTASTQLHNRMLKRVLYGMSSFFHQTPAGRILNRFSKDIDETKEELKEFKLRDLFDKLRLSDKEFENWFKELNLLHTQRVCECGKAMCYKWIKNRRNPL